MRIPYTPSLMILPCSRRQFHYMRLPGRESTNPIACFSLLNKREAKYLKLEKGINTGKSIFGWKRASENYQVLNLSLNIFLKIRNFRLFF